MNMTTETKTGHALSELTRLMQAHTRYVPAGFSIDLGHDTRQWDLAIRTLGVKEACRHMAEQACAGYEQYRGVPFLFSDECVAYEIKYHLDAFMVSQGFAGYHRNLAAMLLPRPLIASRCREIDISAGDARDLKQRYVFHYKKGIRACHRGTENDPFRRRKRKE